MGRPATRSEHLQPRQGQAQQEEGHRDPDRHRPQPGHADRVGQGGQGRLRLRSSDQQAGLGRRHGNAGDQGQGQAVEEGDSPVGRCLGRTVCRSCGISWPSPHEESTEKGQRWMVDATSAEMAEVGIALLPEHAKHSEAVRDKVEGVRVLLTRISGQGRGRSRRDPAPARPCWGPQPAAPDSRRLHRAGLLTANPRDELIDRQPR